ncbi:hypothetical protein TRICI_004344 [Trichomonascus ciferrii]|uniref:Uncharacterized protein n=1 Tax=Trichomonascus ciferrii TaxID=44093 RepID=A0A642V7J5_9ASCO|nr:hypothetical protein TRICI_004344 [Trichomonascus ciferrii]
MGSVQFLLFVEASQSHGGAGGWPPANPNPMLTRSLAHARLFFAPARCVCATPGRDHHNAGTNDIPTVIQPIVHPIAIVSHHIPPAAITTQALPCGAAATTTSRAPPPSPPRGRCARTPIWGARAHEEAPRQPAAAGDRHSAQLAG